MSLLDSAFEEFTMLDKTTTPDGYGGYYSQWREGATIQAAATFDTSIEARVAGVQGVTSLYTITTRKSVNLQYHDVLRRESDGKVFRVTSDGDDKKTPSSASLDMRQVTAEEWDLHATVEEAETNDGQSTSTT